MNCTIRHLTLSLFAGSMLLGASLPAAAADSVGARVATGVGRIIAAQGNAALAHIREELKDNLLDTLKPLLPDEQTRAPAEGRSDQQAAAKH